MMFLGSHRPEKSPGANSFANEFCTLPLVSKSAINAYSSRFALNARYAALSKNAPPSSFSTLIGTSERAITEPTPMIQSTKYRTFAVAIPSAVAMATDLLFRSELLTINKKSGPGLMSARKCAVMTVNTIGKFYLF